MKKSNSLVEALHRVALFAVIIPASFGCQSITGPESAGELSLSATGKYPVRMGGVEGIGAITIVYSGVQVLREVSGEEEWVDIDVGVLSEPERTFDLLSVLGGFEAILGEVTIEPGFCQKMRVRVKRASITVNGDVSPLKIRGNALRINEQFEVGPDGHPALPLDFSASEAVREKGRGKHRYMMRGIFRLGAAPPPLETGTISGVIVPAVYALVKVYVSGTNDLAASVYTDPDTNGFTLAHLMAGVYDLEASAPGYYSGWELGVALAAGELSDGHVLEMIEEVGGEKR